MKMLEVHSLAFYVQVDQVRRIHFLETFGLSLDQFEALIPVSV